MRFEEKRDAIQQAKLEESSALMFQVFSTSRCNSHHFSKSDAFITLADRPKLLRDIF